MAFVIGTRPRIRQDAAVLLNETPLDAHQHFGRAAAPIALSRFIKRFDYCVREPDKHRRELPSLGRGSFHEVGLSSERARRSFTSWLRLRQLAFADLSSAATIFLGRRTRTATGFGFSTV
jgi:hypothetical protein